MQEETLVKQSSRPEWFDSWFDSEHYQRLYAHRDDGEASRFVDRLVARLGVAGRASILDLCCGNGRHAVRLASRGFSVTGLDLSTASLALARARGNHAVHWMRHDMRRPFGNAAYDYILNLFTSFGYFEDPADHFSVVSNIARALKPEGRVVIDFLNVRHAERHLRRHEIIRRDAIVYHITRWSDRAAIFKRIVIDDPVRKVPFALVERVARLALRDFELTFAQCGLQFEAIYGDYTLTPFDVHSSDRLILVARKKEAATRNLTAGKRLADTADGLRRHAEI
jgi:SAM-dependent methyltransferase